MHVPSKFMGLRIFYVQKTSLLYSVGVVLALWYQNITHRTVAQTHMKNLCLLPLELDKIIFNFLKNNLIFNIVTLCLSNFLCHWTKIPDTYNLKKKKFILVHFSVYSHLTPRQNGMAQRLSGGIVACLVVTRKQRMKDEASEGKIPFKFLFPKT